MNETYNEVDTSKYIKSYMFIKGFAVAKNLRQTLIALAVATSIDALAVGVSFAFMDVALIPSCLIIGGVTFVICVGGGMLGRYIPWLTGKRAEIFGGLILIGIGIKLLIEGVFL